MTTNYLSILLMLTIPFLFGACEKDDPVIPNEEELITTLNYTLTPVGGGTAVTLSFMDLDGDGGDEPVMTGGTLEANKSYTGTLELLNEVAIPDDNITQEIQEEAEEHQFFFQSTVAGLTVAYNDEDANGNPIGLSSTVSTGMATSGTLTITLRHEPSKTASGVSDGDITNANGETDIEVSFPIDVQ